MTEDEIHTQIKIIITDACENSNQSYCSKDCVQKEISYAYSEIVEYIDMLKDMIIQGEIK